ncbi:geranylgeranylglycerol-phosphate geranylgeranyltransferase [Litoribacter ruber]|uniref:Geranylgeranylglycerol-phosphate geranylgeranyltransferase n=1 Tax=Litoribacter ruber TaxID=702568 RepID=A0AAP2CH36_9BACT|nr:MULTISPECIES: geranylgeranylglycerol-phosphate geranylgeranyltransferase [Litoribacter]MBS9523645.1 geranylgeranylglycerol-phosphate geranylgeranyltransferase [Litoribacter alkaliphilus]MBT0812159.1 geranylgeranylglycerol-phosphate geranylgeranyltransferase [Litoribacter ruber]
MKVQRRAKKFTMEAFWKIIRPANLLIVALAQLLTAYFLIEETRTGIPILQDPNLYLIIISTVLLTASGYMINDYYDVKIDYVNRPHEVVVGKGMRRRVVMTLHTIFNFTGIGIGFLVSPRIAIINFFAAFVLWLYSNTLKRMPFIGNLTVALLGGMAIWIIGYYYQTTKLYVLTYAIFAFFINLIREIIKDIEDRQGDRKHGCRTLPIVIGFRATKKVIFAIAGLFVMSILVVTFKVGSDLLYFYFGGLSILFFYFMYRIYYADRKKHFTQLSLLAKILMLTGILSMAFL